MGSSTEHSAYGPIAQPLGPRPDPRRLRRRLGRGRRGVRGAAGHRHRHRRLDPPAGRRHRHGRRQADLRRGLPLRPRRARQQPGPGRPGARARCSTPPCCTRSSAGTTRWTPPRIDAPVPAGRRGRPPRATSRACGSASSRSSAARATSRASATRFEESVQLLVDAGAEVVEVSCPSFDYALAAYYLILPSEASLQPGQVRRHALRPAGAARGRRRPERRAGDGGHPRRRLRRRGQAPDHPGHLRPVQRLLRRLLRPGAEGPHADLARLRRRVRAGRRAGLAHRADHGVQPRREARRPDGDVPQRHRHDPGQPRRRPGHVAAERPRRRGRAADRHPDPRPGDRATSGCTASARPWRRCSPSAGAARCWPGRPNSRPRRRSAHEHHHSRAGDGLRRGAAAVRPGDGPRGPRRAQHRDQDVLRLRDRVRRRAEQPGLPGLPRPARRAARGQRQGGRVGDPDRAGAQLRDRDVVPVRPEELLLPGHAEELPDLAVRRADRLRRLPRRRARGRLRPSGSRSSAPTWRRTPASRCTSAAPPAGSTAPTTRWSTTTGPASR